MSLISRRIMSVYGLTGRICYTKSSFDRLTYSSEIIVESNPASLEQLVSEGYQYVFVYEMSLQDFLNRNAGAARVVSNPLFQFVYGMYDVLKLNNIISTIAISTIGRNFPTPKSDSSITLSKLITDPTAGVISGIQKLITDCLKNNFKFTTSFSPHIFQSNCTIINPFTGISGPAERLVLAMIDDNNRVLLIGTSFPPQLFL